MVRKKKPGTVTVSSKQGKIRLVLPRIVGNGQQVHLYTGYPDTPKNRKKAAIIALEIESDIQSETLDGTLQKYRKLINDFRNQQSIINTKLPPDLSELWERYCAFKQSQVANSTFHKDFLSRYANAIEKLPSQDIEDAALIFEFVVNNYPNYTAKRLITQMNAVCKWGVKLKIIGSNPFEGMASEIKVSRYSWRNIDFFNERERDAIISAFESHSTFGDYAPYVKFLFLTGCRTSEAIALRWKNIKKECTEIYFSESYTHGYGRKSTKNHENRTFPCNESLQEFLLNLRPDRYRSDSLVFPSPLDGREIKSNTLIRAWKAVVQHLVEQGLVSRFRTAYNCRHSFINHCLSRGIPIQVVASWVNSPEVILQHYAGCSNDIAVPEFSRNF
jgi:integrase